MRISDWSSDVCSSDLVPDTASRAAHAVLDDAKWRQISWRRGTKGRLSARFAVMRVRIADGPPQRLGASGAQPMPGAEAWLSGEHRSSGERQTYLSTPPPDTPVRAIPRPPTAPRHWQTP